jgi:hypothetical protein
MHRVDSMKMRHSGSDIQILPSLNTPICHTMQSNRLLDFNLLILELRTIIHTHKASSKMAPTNSSYNKTMGRQLDETEAVQSTPNDTCDSANNQGLSERISYLLLMQRNEILKDPEHFRLLRKNIYMISS